MGVGTQPHLSQTSQGLTDLQWSLLLTLLLKRTRLLFPLQPPKSVHWYSSHCASNSFSVSSQPVTKEPIELEVFSGISSLIHISTNVNYSAALKKITPLHHKTNWIGLNVFLSTGCRRISEVWTSKKRAFSKLICHHLLNTSQWTRNLC